jgi:hypothetical protein
MGSNNNDCHPERTDRVLALLGAREEKGFLERFAGQWL